MPIFKKRTQIRFIQWLFPLLETYCPPCAHWFACWLFLRPFRFPFTLAERESLKDSEAACLTINQQKVCVYEWGSGPYLLFVHGWSGRGTNLCAFIEPIVSRGMRLIAFDAPAHGKSEGTNTNFLEFIDAMEAIESRYGPPAGYIGHSLGGMAVYHRVEKSKRNCPLIMISSPSEETDIFRTFFRRLHGKGNQSRKLKEWVILKNPEKLLLIHDKEDVDCSVEDSIKLHKANSGSELILTEGLGHLSILKNAQVIENTLYFLEKHLMD